MHYIYLDTLIIMVVCLTMMQRSSKLCVFCGQDESIDHMFLHCSTARLILSLLKCAFDLNSIMLICVTALEAGLEASRRIAENWFWLALLRCFGLFGDRCWNDIIFESKIINDPMMLIKLMCSWIMGWSILWIKEAWQKVLMLGAKLTERVASEVYRALHGWMPGVMQMCGWCCCIFPEDLYWCGELPYHVPVCFADLLSSP